MGDRIAWYSYPAEAGGPPESWAYDPRADIYSLPRHQVLHDDFKTPAFRTRMEYNPMGRLTGRIPESTTGSAQSRVPVYFSYNARGQRTTMRDASGLTRYFYDELQRQKIKATLQGTLTYEHDLNGNLTRMDATRSYQYDAFDRIIGENPVRSQGLNVTYRWDALNRLEKVHPEEPANEVAYAYEGAELKQVNYPNGIQTVYAYNAPRHLTAVTIQKVVPGQSPSPRAHFDYNAVDPLSPSGRRNSLQEQIQVTPLHARTSRYEYDSLNRLESEEIAAGSLGGTIVYDDDDGYGTGGFGFDPVGNRRSRQVQNDNGLSAAGVTEFSNHQFDANDRLEPAASNFDANGNTLLGNVSPAPAQSAPDEYDYENHLIKRTTEEKTIELVYDGDGNRVRKIIDDSGVKTTILYLTDDRNPTGYAQVVEELESAYGQPPSFRRAYTYGLDLISRVESDQSKFFYCHDGHGSVRFQTSANGTITRHYAYDAFGIRVDGGGYTAEDQYLYAGEHYDPDLGVYYLRARHYNPNTGRFWTMDTFEGSRPDPLSLHKYLYAHADPPNRIDPSGHGDFTLIGTLKVAGIQGVIGAALVGAIDYAVHRELNRAAKAAGWGFVIGAGTGATFHGIRAIIAARGAAQALGVTVTTTSSQLITATTDGYLLGVITKEGTIQLFKSGPGVFVNGVEILGHPDLIRAGLVAAGEAEGFAIAVQAGQVTKIFVNSSLNAAERGFVLATEKTAAIIDALGARAAQIFGY